MFNKRLFTDRVFKRFMQAAVLFVVVLSMAMLAGFCWKSLPILESSRFIDLIFSSSWRPSLGQFGFAPFIAGTLWVSALAIIIAAPLSILTAVFLSEYAPGWLTEKLKPAIDLLSGIPSVVFGVWGVLIVVPFVKDHIAPAFGKFSSGYCVLSAGIVLAVMIFPIIINVSLEVFRTIPKEMKDASIALGATKWQTVKHVVLRRAAASISAAVLLGLSRAFGETFAVLMVAGNVAKMPRSLLDPAYPLPALIANNYGEMMSVPMYDSALLFSALLLLMVVVGFNVAARVVLAKFAKRAA